MNLKKHLICTFTSILICVTSYSQYTTLLNFAGASNGDQGPGSLFSDGIFLYGMTRLGGANDMGTIFKMLPDGTGYVKLLDFTGVGTGSFPLGSALVSDGTFLYGMTEFGGINNKGTIFKIMPDGTGFVKLFDFSFGFGGMKPEGSLIFDGIFLYGMTWVGGANQNGTIFKIMPNGTGFTVLMDFTGITNGRTPIGSLLSDGVYLYGMTSGGGINDDGTIFKILPNGTGFVKLLDFNGVLNGRLPGGSLIFDGIFLYGMTTSGGSNDMGTIFKILPNGSSYLKLYDFGCGTNGDTPFFTSLIFDGGFLYGMTEFGGINNKGTMFKIIPDGTGYTKLFDFAGVTSGGAPAGSLISDGLFLYGMTTGGGLNDMGTVFKLSIPINANSLTYCAEETIQLTASGGVSYLWEGPLSFLSTAQNPSISSSTTNMSGTYTVTITDAYGCMTSSSAVVTINPLPTATISAPQYLCEMTPNSISINSSSVFQSILWSTNPSGANYAFSGQGTSTITPSPNPWPTALDVTVTVNAVDLNGCQFLSNILLEDCCSPDTDNWEFFERTYTSNGAGSLSNQLPAGYYNGPTAPIVINLPPAQSLANQYSTPFTGQLPISQFIALNPSIISSGNISTNNWILFNNDIIIDIPTTFLNCDFIRFAPGAKMIVQPGITLTMTTCTLAPRCNEMWGGIEMANNSEFVDLTNVSIIAAEKGISSVSGGRYRITNCRFIDNYIGISVKGYLTANTLSTVDNTYFGDVTGQNLLQPYQLEPQPLHGLFIQNILDIVVGPNTIGNGNLFHNHQRGITSIKSTVHSYKNNFHNIRHTVVPVLNEGDKFAAIFADNSNVFFPPGANLNHKLWVGGTALNRNNFVNCEFGISSKKLMNLDARWNFMKNCALRGISAEENPKKRMDIYNNEINSTNSNAWGIYVKNYSNGIANVYYNQINTTTFAGPFGTINRFAAGIYISSVNPTVVQTTNVVGNTVQNCLYGIWMINTLNGVIDGNTINMNFTNAVINSLSSIFAPIRGILVQNSTKAQIKNNTITRNLGPGNGVINDNLQGIRLELSPSSYVWKNTMTKTAVGFYALGSNLGSRVECNTMNLNRNGFWMQLADISNQGQAPGIFPNGLSAHNVWNSNYLNNSEGTTINHGPGNLLLYHHASGVNLNSNPTPFLAGFPNFWTDITLPPGAQTTCGVALNVTPIVLTTPAEQRLEQMGIIVGGGIIYDSLDIEMKHYLKQSVLSRLKQDPNLQNLGASDDYLYQEYVFNMDASSINQQLSIQEKIALESNDTASILINQMVTSDQSLQLNLTVESIWNNSKLNDVPISSNDSLTLFDIACSDPLLNGSAVYQARAILDWDGFCASSQFRSSSENPIEIESVRIECEVFPNPSMGEITVVSTSNIKSIDIIDLKGLILKSFEVENTSIDINTQLNTGIYVLRIILDDGRIETHKISIQ